MFALLFAPGMATAPEFPRCPRRC